MLTFFLTFVAVGQVLIGAAGNNEGITEITVGSYLHLNTTAGKSPWRSPSGRFAFGFYNEDDLKSSVGVILYHSGNKSFRVWTAVAYQVFLRPAGGDFVLSFTEKGFLLTPPNASESIALIRFNGTKSTRAAMMDNGNFVVYDSTISKSCGAISAPIGNDAKSDSCIVWQSFDNPTDTMLGGQVLNCGANLTSHFLNIRNTSYYKLSMQCDSNLVLYTVKVLGNISAEITPPLWTSQTSGKGYKKLQFGEDGRLFLSNPNGTDQYTLAKYNPSDREANMIYIAQLQNDRYFKLYALNLRTNNTEMVYEIPTLFTCQFQYFCGVNSYCVVVNNKADCRCLPGFKINDLNDSTKGCRRTIAVPNCGPPGSSDASALSMEQVGNLVWHDEAYSIVPAENEEDCRSKCLMECNCEAAVFFNQNCAKHKLPMINANTGTNFTSISTAFLKLAAEGSGGETEKRQKRKRYLVAMILCGTIDAGVLLALLFAGAGSYWFFYGRYRLLWRKWEMAFQEEVAPRSFSYQELAKATNSFSTELGRGGHATVYKGHLTMHGKPNPVPVAVKRLSLEAGDGESDFQAEIRIIGRAHHVNLVRLLGFCYEESKRLLIYEYMSKGSLADLMCLQLDDPPSLKQRARFLLDVAMGINYLHRECETKIIHRDIKPENILITDNWRVKISDFGISKILVEGVQNTPTKRTSAPGTPGYVAPECVQSKGGNLTEKADVYSFGIVILETIFWERNTGDNNLLKSARKGYEDMEGQKKVELSVTDLEKQRMGEHANVQLEMVKLGLLCVREEPDERPDIEEFILPKLEEVVAVLSPAAAVTAQIVSFGINA